MSNVDFKIVLDRREIQITYPIVSSSFNSELLLPLFSLERIDMREMLCRNILISHRLLWLWLWAAWTTINNCSSTLTRPCQKPWSLSPWGKLKFKGFSNHNDIEVSDTIKVEKKKILDDWKRLTLWEMNWISSHLSMNPVMSRTNGRSASNGYKIKTCSGEIVSYLSLEKVIGVAVLTCRMIQNPPIKRAIGHAMNTRSTSHRRAKIGLLLAILKVKRDDSVIACVDCG